MHEKPCVSVWLPGWFLLGVLLGGSVAAAEKESHDEPARRPNVLFIAIDDLRNDLGCLGITHAKTPSLDAFAATARVFSHHYVHVPTCGASRCALLRGQYPKHAVHLSNNAIKQTQKDWIRRSLPGWFQQNDYRTLSIGKISHYPGNLTGKDWNEGPQEMPGVWERSWIPNSPWPHSQAMMHGYGNGLARRPGKSHPFEAFDGPDEAYPDAWVAGDAIQTLDELQSGEQPWFFAVGFFKPHLPFAAPKRWWDLHDADNLAAPAVTTKPEGISGWHNSGEFRGNYGHDYEDVNGQITHRDPASDAEYAKTLRHGYAAAVSYVDAQVGRLLSKLDQVDPHRKTIVVIWSDHGFLLGEHAIWGKHCLYENAVRSPLMIRLPGLQKAGEISESIVQTVDVFPTLTDLCGLPKPAELDGQSLRPLLTDPQHPWERPAFAFWTGNRRSIRTERWRLIVHPGRDTKAQTADAFELFDMQSDPNESTNVAIQHPEIISELIAELP
ncbi:MAG: sulfatase [Planctomycetaceae bacterium]